MWFNLSHLTNSIYSISNPYKKESSVHLLFIQIILQCSKYFTSSYQNIHLHYLLCQMFLLHRIFQLVLHISTIIFYELFLLLSLCRFVSLLIFFLVFQACLIYLIHHILSLLHFSTVKIFVSWSLVFLLDLKVFLFIQLFYLKGHITLTDLIFSLDLRDQYQMDLISLLSLNLHLNPFPIIQHSATIFNCILNLFFFDLLFLYFLSLFSIFNRLLIKFGYHLLCIYWIYPCPKNLLFLKCLHPIFLCIFLFLLFLYLKWINLAIMNKYKVLQNFYVIKLQVFDLINYLNLYWCQNYLIQLYNNSFEDLEDHVMTKLHLN